MATYIQLHLSHEGPNFVGKYSVYGDSLGAYGMMCCWVRDKIDTRCVISTI